MVARVTSSRHSHAVSFRTQPATKDLGRLQQHYCPVFVRHAPQWHLPLRHKSQVFAKCDDRFLLSPCHGQDSSVNNRKHVTLCKKWDFFLSEIAPTVQLYKAWVELLLYLYPIPFEDFCGCLYETIHHDNTGSLAVTVSSEEKLEDPQ
jgi:hypothetical protein